ncbi:MAG: hypothetical protein KDC54_12955 [Lewinella sp.]|nr:hypothetical protein [Lewinella sp.]
MCDQLGAGEIRDQLRTDEQLYILQARTGCWVSNLRDAEDCQLRYAPEGRESLDALILLAGQPHLIIDGYRLRSLVDTSRQQAFAAEQLTKVVEPLCYLGTSRGEILIGTANDGLLVFRPHPDGRFTSTPTRWSTAGGKLPGNRVQALFEDSDGTIWIGTDAGLASWRGDSVCNLSRPRAVSRWRALFHPREAEPLFCASVTAIAQWYGSLLVAGPGHVHKLQLRPDSLTYLHRYSLDERLPEPLTTVYSLALDGNGNLWVAGNQLFCFDITNDQLEPIAGTRTYHPEQVRCLTYDPVGQRIWLGQSRRGMYHLPVAKDIARQLLPGGQFAARGSSATSAPDRWLIRPNEAFYATELFEPGNVVALNEHGEAYLNMLGQEFLQFQATGTLLKLHITGHVARDQQLDERELLALSNQQAEKARTFLIEMGVAPGLIQTWAAGSQTINQDCTGNPASHCNNRLEFIVHMRH